MKLDFDSISQNNLDTALDSARRITPDLYQSLENPSNLNIYSELDTSQFKDFYRQQKPALTRPIIHRTRPNPYNHKNSQESQLVNG